jgi:hypothetical protein
MDGVVILESFEVAIAWAETFCWVGAVAMGLALAFFGGPLGVILGLITIDKNKSLFCLSIISPILIGLIIGLLKGGYWLSDKTPTEYETQYKIALESNVNYKEFTDKYEIIDFENNVYTVRDKE